MLPHGFERIEITVVRYLQSIGRITKAKSFLVRGVPILLHGL